MFGNERTAIRNTVYSFTKQTGGESLTALPSSGGRRSKRAAKRRGYLCPKMLNVLFSLFKKK